ncbi:hypothetical protein [Niabella ginsenosidivorans]|uniref:hypothetical protein n=1 Tax=Niabella ginsenosidivorans TaxID=1176587 RepID=UPI0012EDE7B3|nr:hypothetical protein [Niabella ginsenosidivorans]
MPASASIKPTKPFTAFNAPDAGASWLQPVQLYCIHYNRYGVLICTGVLPARGPV